MEDENTRNSASTRSEKSSSTVGHLPRQSDDTPRPNNRVLTRPKGHRMTAAVPWQPTKLRRAVEAPRPPHAPSNLHELSASTCPNEVIHHPSGGAEPGYLHRHNPHVVFLPIRDPELVQKAVAVHISRRVLLHQGLYFASNHASPSVDVRTSRQFPPAIHLSLPTFPA